MEKPARRNVVMQPIQSAANSNSVTPSAPQNYSSPKTQVRKNKGLVIIIAGVLAAITIVVAFMAYPLVYMRSAGLLYTPEYLAPIEVRHEVVSDAKDAAIPKVEQLITPDVKKQLLEGKGQEVILITTYKGKEDERNKFVIEPWKTYEETSPAARQKLVADKSAELQTKLQNLAVYAPREWNFVVLVDDTDGVSPELRAKYQIMYDELLIKERLAHGDGMTLHFAKLSFTDYIQEKTATIPKGGRIPEDVATQMRDAQQWLLKARGASASSSVFRGLLNILSEYAKQPRTRVVILSDMMENDLAGTKVSFYKPEGQKLLGQDQWGNLDTMILTDVKKPDLTGLSVKIYAPPSVVKYSKVAKAAQAYSEHLLTSLGAEVETKFG